MLSWQQKEVIKSAYEVLAHLVFIRNYITNIGPVEI